MRKSYGNTWWGQQWLNALKNIDFSSRLPRGKTYANKGFVKALEFKNNGIKAAVKGSSRLPYEVEFWFDKFTEKQKAQLIQTIIDKPMILSSLLNRQLPPELFELCSAHQIDLFPYSWDDMRGTCSCPDWAVPCKHMAAALYITANKIDENPFIIFELHGFNIIENLEKAGHNAQVQQDIRILKIENLVEAFQDKKLPNFEVQQLQKINFATLKSCKSDWLKILSPKPPFFPNGDFIKILNTSYTQISKLLTKKEQQQQQNNAINTTIDSIAHVELLINKKLELLDATCRDARSMKVIDFQSIKGLTEWLDQLSPLRIPQYSPELIELWLVWRFAQKIATQQGMIPQLISINKGYKIRWIPALINPQINQIFKHIESFLPKNSLFYHIDNSLQQPIASDYLLALTSLFLNHIVKSNTAIQDRYWETEAVQLFFNDRYVPFNHYEVQNYPEAIQLWLNKFFIAEKIIVPVLQVEEAEMDFEVNIAFEDGRKKNKPLFKLKSLFTKKQYEDIKMDALRDLSMLSEYFPDIKRLIQVKGELPLSYDTEEFVHVLFNIIPIIQLFGIKVMLPKSLRKLIKPQLSMQISADNGGAVKGKSLVNLNNLLSFEWRVALGDQVVSQSEFLKMAKQFKGIVKFNQEYVFFDEVELNKLIDALENPPEMDSNDLLKTILAEEYQGAKIELTPELEKNIHSLLNEEAVEPPISLEATLRPYQQRGYAWLYRNSRLGFGSLIADDMGLGKTLQVITTLLKFKEDGAFDEEKGLVIVPTTLLTNWDKEIKKFAPELITHTYHGSNRCLKPLQEADVLITTYGVARTDHAKLKKHPWLILVIDEAQNIKNPSTAQTKAIKKLNIPIKIAMSGTPVENRMSEYWSVFDFANKGYLKTLKDFTKEFAKPIETDGDSEKLELFKKITAPFIMRRVKSDKSIIKDLPDKIEQDQYCSLSPEQAAIYQNIVDDALKRVEKADGIERKGLILMMITKLKQICNHPYQFLKKGDRNATLSGKTILLFQLLQQILDKGEKTLIFTQYQEMGKLLAELLKENYNLDVPFLHGGVSRKGRDAMVEDFQNNRATRIMILSLKAGGTGLNLTQANNVIHYDLWWNPAVEAQATDRAYRIGQEKNVMVHRFITKNTFEEKINQLLQSKRELANLTVSNGEKWIGEFNNNELKELVSLTQ